MHLKSLPTGWLLKIWEGGLTLSILALGHLVAVAMGPLWLLMVMTGHEKDTASALAAAAGINLALNLTLIPTWGTVGAAMASAFSIVCLHLLLLWRVRARTGIHFTLRAWGRLGSQENENQ